VHIIADAGILAAIDAALHKGPLGIR
jgi:hypothetical protein